MPTKTATPKAWVTKTDLVRFTRCPYAFDQLRRDAITALDLLDEPAIQRIEDGIGFEQHVVKDAVAAPDVGLPALLASDATLARLPLLENADLRLRGIPDGVVADHGALLPVEIKSHKHLRHSDEVELAFYWLLLEPYRTRHVEPRGWVILRRDGQPHEVEVAITDALLADVAAVIEQVRACMREGARPRICPCVACRGLLRQGIEAATREARDLSLIWGIGRHYIAVLEAQGVTSYQQLLQRDPDELAAAVRGPGVSIGAPTIRRWQHHARAYASDQPVFFGPALPARELIVLDLEYSSTSGEIWLAGLHVLAGDTRKEHAFWADTPAEELELLHMVAQVAEQHRELPIVTWGGNGADLPKLIAAACRHGVPKLVDALAERHVDAFLHIAGSFRLPVPTLKVDHLAGYFGAIKTSAIRDGLEAEMRYAQYTNSRSSAQRADLRDELTVYNRDDLLATATVLQAIDRLATETAARMKGGAYRVLGAARIPCHRLPLRTRTGCRVQSRRERRRGSSVRVGRGRRR